MTSIITFTGFTPARPAQRQFDLWRLIVPPKRRREDDAGDVRRWIGCLQEVADLLLADVDGFVPALVDVDRCDDTIVAYMLQDLGNPFPLEDWDVSAITRRKLASTLVALYKLRGTAPGIEAAVRLLLGQDVTVVPYLRTGWRLGVDTLGEGTQAHITNVVVGPYPFVALPPPWTIAFALEGGTPQVVTFTAADFVSVSAATAAEVRAALEAQLTGVEAVLVHDGEPAVLHGTAGPYALSGGEALILILGTTTYEIIFHADDFAIPGAATMDEVIRAIRAAQIPGLRADVFPILNTLAISSQLRGPDAYLRSSPSAANTASAPMGIVAGSVAVGKDGYRVRLYSTHAHPASIACVTPGTSADLLLGFIGDPASSTGGAILGPSLTRSRYTFDIETATAVDATTEARIRDIANLWRCAREHVGRVRTAPTFTRGGWALGLSQLDLDTTLGP